MASIRLTDRASHRNRGIRNTIAIRRAQRAGQKYAFLELQNSRGLFKIVGGRRRPRIRMVWDLSRASVRIPPSPTLEPTVVRVRKRSVMFWRVAMLKQLRRARVFGY